MATRFSFQNSHMRKGSQGIPSFQKQIDDSLVTISSIKNSINLDAESTGPAAV